MLDNAQSSAGFATLFASVKRYVSLLIEDTRLNVTEKLTRLLSAVAMAALITIIGTVALVFISIACCVALTDVFSPLWAFIIVAAFFVVLLVVLMLCKKALIINPIARFLSTLLLDAPHENPENPSHDQPSSVSGQ
ncbi:MAG: phage holin family protein [Muribaculaceae bacterium]|nr:phage holin family protein [Muribaculaceae bacterium]